MLTEHTGASSTHSSRTGYGKWGAPRGLSAHTASQAYKKAPRYPPGLTHDPAFVNELGLDHESTCH